MTAIVELGQTAAIFEDRPDSIVVGVTLGTIREALAALQNQGELVEATRELLEDATGGRMVGDKVRAVLAKVEGL